MVEERKQMRKDDMRRWQKNVKKNLLPSFIREGHEEVKTKKKTQKKSI